MQIKPCIKCETASISALSYFSNPRLAKNNDLLKKQQQDDFTYSKQNQGKSSKSDFTCDAIHAKSANQRLDKHKVSQSQAREA